MAVALLSFLTLKKWNGHQLAICYVFKVQGQSGSDRNTKQFSAHLGSSLVIFFQSIYMPEFFGNE